MHTDSQETKINYTREKILWSVVVPQAALMTISTLWIYFYPSKKLFSYFRTFNIKIVFFGILIGVVLAALGYIFYICMKKFNKMSAVVELFEQAFSPAFKNLKTVDIFILSIVSGFSEEVFFRGLLLNGIGIIFSSLAFGLLHMPNFKLWIYAVWAFLSGVLFCYLLIWSGSLWLPIISHVVNNSIGMILLKKIKN